MKVYVKELGFGRYLDLYFVIETIPQRLVSFVSNDNGITVMREDVIDETVELVSPSLQIPRDWVAPLVDALTDYKPQKMDQLLLDVLKKEQERVDKLLDRWTSAWRQK